MAVNYAYNYARIDVSTGRCTGIQTRSDVVDNPAMIPIEVYSYDYYGKYYNRADGKWYEDAAFTIEWAEPTA